MQDVEARTARAKSHLAEAEAQTGQAKKRAEEAIQTYKKEERALAALVAKRGRIEQIELLDKEIAALTVQKSALTEELDRLRVKFAS